MKPYIVGLTGQSGAGKTTVSKTFENNGFNIINADLISRYVTTENKECLSKLKAVFFDYFEKGILNRRKLASLVFSDRKELEKLTSITYPYIIREINRRISEFSDNSIILIDAPTLFESGLNACCDKIVSVVSREDLRLYRIIKRDNISECEVRKRFSSQKSECFFKKNSDFLIENNSSEQDLINKAINTVQKIKEFYYGKKET